MINKSDSKQNYVMRIPNDLKPMDMLLFRGEGLVSELIMFGHKKNTAFSHVGVVYDSNIIFHSTTLMGNIPDFISGSPFSGVQLNDLRETIKRYNGEVFVRRAIVQLEDRTKFQAQVERFYGTPYEENYGDLVGAEIDTIFDDHSVDFSSVFCSELVAELANKVMSAYLEYPPDEYTPTDCSRAWIGQYGSDIEKIKWKV